MTAKVVDELVVKVRMSLGLLSLSCSWFCFLVLFPSLFNRTGMLMFDIFAFLFLPPFYLYPVSFVIVQTGIIHSVTDSMSMLDMIQSFATYVSLSEQMTRPEISEVSIFCFFLFFLFIMIRTPRLFFVDKTISFYFFFLLHLLHL